MKTVLITGASSGIGAAAAWQASQAGWSVLAGYGQGASRAQGLVEKIKASGGQAHAVALTLDSSETVAPQIDAMMKHTDRVDALVLNASPAPSLESFLNVRSDEWLKQFRVNVLSSHALIVEIWKRFFQIQKGGHVIGLLSAALGPPMRGHMSPYLVAKRGLLTLLEAALAELGTGGLRVSTISPGYTQTPMLKAFHPLVLESAKASIPGGQFLSPEKVAEQIVYCLDHCPLEPLVDARIIVPGVSGE